MEIGSDTTMLIVFGYSILSAVTLVLLLRVEDNRPERHIEGIFYASLLWPVTLLWVVAYVVWLFIRGSLNKDYHK